MKDIVFGVSTASCLDSRGTFGRKNQRAEYRKHACFVVLTQTILSTPHFVFSLAASSVLPNFGSDDPHHHKCQHDRIVTTAHVVHSGPKHILHRKNVSGGGGRGDNGRGTHFLPFFFRNGALRQKLGRGPPVGVHHHRPLGPDAAPSPPCPYSASLPSQANADSFIAFHQNLIRKRAKRPQQ